MERYDILVSCYLFVCFVNFSDFLLLFLGGLGSFFGGKGLFCFSLCFVFLFGFVCVCFRTMIISIIMLQAICKVSKYFRKSTHCLTFQGKFSTHCLKLMIHHLLPAIVLKVSTTNDNV